MLKRLKNLWNLSKYEVYNDIEVTANGMKLREQVLIDVISKPKGKARIIDETTT